jgi:hypothetical protein
VSADGGARDGGAQDGGADAGPPPCAPCSADDQAAGTCTPTAACKIGTACQQDADCLGSDSQAAFCFYGICTRECESGQPAGNPIGSTGCNDARFADTTAGVMGNAYTCWPLGPNLISLCWPNGSGASCAGGAACTRSDEVCISNKCQYGAGTSTTVPRTDVTCHKDGECKSNESCAILFNLQNTNIRSEGICLYRINGRKAGGESCTTADECGSQDCGSDNTCTAICVADGDCPTQTSRKCTVVGLLGSQFDEFATEFIGFCQAWAGSKTACTANSGCAATESCSIYQDLVNNDTAVALKGACRTYTNAAGAAVGAACSADSQCKSNNCLTSVVTGNGYCTDTCLGGDADCANGTVCRAITFNSMDPSTPNDDLRAGFCTNTAAGNTCFIDFGCKSCTAGADGGCLDSQGVHCKVPTGASTGICYDPFGRCADPCKSGCTLGGASGTGGCSAGFTCKQTVINPQTGATANFCSDDVTGDCERSDQDQVLLFEDGMCGDALYGTDADGGTIRLPQSDICYYYGRVTVDGGLSEVFTCGQGCPADGGACPSIPGSGGSIATTCRTVYSFGVNLPDGGGTIAGHARSPQQCAPNAAFTGVP